MSTENSQRGKGLKFKDPGVRDTVLRKSSADNMCSSQSDPKVANPILDKIKHTLAHSDPAKWEKYGEPLNISGKYPKAYERWETAYCIDLPNGLLTFRSSMAVNSEYFGGGYTISANGPEAFFIELRPRSWDPKTLIDPFFRSTLEKDKQFKLLADGDVAKELYGLIEKTYKHFHSEQKNSISESIIELANNILEIAADSEVDVWEKFESENGQVSFSTMCSEIKVEISRSKRMDSFSYNLIFSKDSLKSPIKDPTLAKDLFSLIDEKYKNAALEALQNVLDEAGF